MSDFQIPGNIDFFFRVAVKQAIAKLEAAGYLREVAADQIAEYLTRPGHIADLLEHAKELHFQAIEYVEQHPEEIRREYDSRKHEAAYPGF